MKRFSKIDYYNQLYANELKDALEEVIPFLVQAFTQFYGEDYRRQISDVIKQIRYTFFISKTHFEILMEENINIRYQRLIRYYLHYIQYRALKCKDFDGASDQLEKEMLRVLVPFSSFSENALLHNNIIECLEVDAPLYTFFYEDGQFWKSILLPILALNLEMVIHEINHALMIDVVAYTDEAIVMPSLFVTRECDELFNDYISYQVLDIYQKMNAPISHVFKRFPFYNDYENYFYLIEVFYYVFQHLIKESIMTKNFNLLWKYAGQDDFQKFCELVESYYLRGVCTEEEFSKLEDLIYQMNNHALAIKECGCDEVISDLEKQGYFVRRLGK